MKKKMLALVLAMFMCLSALTGCALITRNDELYYGATVATITYADGTQEKIDKRELLVAYSSYGYNYEENENYGYTKEKAVITTIESIVDNYLTRKSVKDYYAEKNEKLLEDSETTYLWDKTYDAVLSNLKGYLSEKAKESGTTSQTENKSVFKDFENKIKLDGTTIKTKTPATTIRATYEAREKNGVVYNFEYIENGKYTFQEEMYANVSALFTGATQSAKNWRSAYKKYINQIKENYSYLNKSSDKEWFMFEMNRVYDILKNNYLVEVYQTIYNESKKQGADVTFIQADQVLRAYEKKVLADYTTYKLQGGAETYAKDMLSNVGDVYYNLEGDDVANYFYVAPIKVQFSTDLKNEIADYKALLADGTYSAEQYNNAMNAIFDIDRTDLVNVRNASGEIVSHTSVNNLIEKLQDAAVSGTIDEKAQAIREYFYLYNDEDTYKNADYNAVFGVSADGKTALTNDTYSNDKIKTAIISLYNDGDAEFGDISSAVAVDDGFYVFVYLGAIENRYAVDKNFSLTTENIKDLASTKTNIFTSKTLLDKLYAELETDNFSVFQNMHMNQLRSKVKSEILLNNVKDLF